MLAVVIITCCAAAGLFASPLEAQALALEGGLPSMEYARVLRALRRHNDAYNVHAALWRQLERDGGTVGQYVALALEMVTDLTNAHDADGADSFLALVRVQLAAELPRDMAALLRRAHARVADCRGDYTAAVAHMAAGTADPALAVSPRTHLDDLVSLRLFLRRVVATAAEPASHHVLGALAEEHRVAAAILALGPWRTAWQTPHDFDGDIASQPWFELRTLPRPLQEAATHLADAAPALLQEFDALEAAGVLDTDQDCLQVTRDNGRGWLRFEPGSVRHADVHAQRTLGCSVSVSPVACALLARLRTVPGLRVLRGGYSAVTSGTWLKPHFAATNQQLKLHVGLRTPTDARSGAPCATMRVGNVTRAWVAGEVLVFDDSFEHEVWNRCPVSASACAGHTPSRVVFQLVIRHPHAVKLDGPDPIRLVIDAQH